MSDLSLRLSWPRLCPEILLFYTAELSFKYLQLRFVYQILIICCITENRHQWKWHIGRIMNKKLWISVRHFYLFRIMRIVPCLNKKYKMRLCAIKMIKEKQIITLSLIFHPLFSVLLGISRHDNIKILLNKTKYLSF